MDPFAPLLAELSQNERFRSTVVEWFDMEQHPYGWLSLVPPIIAIVLAIVTRRILISLFLAILSGALILTYYQAPASTEATPDALGGFLPGVVIDGWNALVGGVSDAWNDHLWPTLVDPEKVSVFLFTCLMGAIVGMVNRAAGMRGLLHLLTPLTGSPRRAQIVTWFSGMLVFFDDYANTMLLGTTFRSMFDRMKISREKLAYIVDSTAAPVAGLAIVSTWIAGELGYITDGVKIGFPADAEVNAFDLFLQSIPYRFYVLWALFFVLLVAITRRDFGPMLKAEVRARRRGGHQPHENSEFLLPEGLDWDRLELQRDQLDARTVEALAVANDPTLAPSGTRSRSLNAIVPIFVTVVAILGFMFQSGYESIGPLPPAVATATADADSGEVATTVAENETPSATEDSGEQTTGSEAAEAVNASVAAVETRAQSVWRVTQWLRDVFGDANSYTSLVWGSLVGFFFTVLWLGAQRVVPFGSLTYAAGTGASHMVPALLVLWLASTLSGMTSGKPTAEYQAQLEKAQTMAHTIVGINQTPDFDKLSEVVKIHETLHLHGIPRDVMVEALAPAYDNPEAFMYEVLNQVNTVQPDGSFYTRYLFQDGVQVDWDKAVKPQTPPTAVPDQDSATRPADQEAEDTAADSGDNITPVDEQSDSSSADGDGPSTEAEQDDGEAENAEENETANLTRNVSGDNYLVVTTPVGKTQDEEGQDDDAGQESSEDSDGAGAAENQQPGPPAGGPPAGGGGGGMGAMMAGRGPAEPDLSEAWEATGNLTFPYPDYRHRLHTGQYLTSLLTRQAGDTTVQAASHPLTPWLPTIIFVLAGFTAFATGSSWGTMGIVMPLAIPLATSILSGGEIPIEQNAIFLATIGSVLAGAVFGDHCSPISDTTVLSSQASGCDHLAHVWTQMPYAISVGLVTVLFGTIPVGFGIPWPLCLVTGTIALTVIVIFMGRTPESMLVEEDTAE